MAQYADLTAKVTRLEGEAEALRTKKSALEDAVRVVAEEIEPEAASPSASILDRTRALPRLFRRQLRSISQASCGHVLAILKSLFPSSDLEPLGGGYAAGTSEEDVGRLLLEVEPIANALSKDIVDDTDEAGPSGSGNPAN